jgi:thiol-disulfide isomerase/thioredoxin
MKTRTIIQAALSGLLLLAASASAGPAASFDLPLRGTNLQAKLPDYAGKILVLDFFAYWCAPCGEASAAIHREIAEHYSIKNGNPAGVPVEVLAVNVEADNPKQTDSFIRKHGMGKVADDRDGKTFEAFKGGDLPLIVVIDGTQGTVSKPKFEVVYRRSGFEGAAKLRDVIDAIPAPSAKPKEASR